jgi:hypothetical protein
VIDEDRSTPNIFTDLATMAADQLRAQGAARVCGSSDTPKPSLSGGPATTEGNPGAGGLWGCGGREPKAGPALVKDPTAG